MKNEVMRFKVTHQDGKGYTVYYKKSGRCFAYNNIWSEKRGILILSPSSRVTKRAYEVALENGGEEF